MFNRTDLSTLVARRNVIFLLITALLFYPFFGGSFLVGGTDTLYNHYPNLLFGYREFHEQGRFGLWNPYIFAGTDFSASMHAHYLNPIYWPPLLVPERYAFHVLTGMFFAFNWLIGVYWGRIADIFGRSNPESILVGVVAQAGMFFWFTVTTMIGVPMYFLSTLAIHAVLSHETRSSWANYLLLTAALGLLFVSGHTIYIIGFFLPVAIVLLARTWPGCLRRPWRGFVGIFVAAAATAVALSLYRTLPVLLAIVREGVYLAQQGLSSFANHGYFALTAFNPTALGIELHEAMKISQLLKIGGIRHTQAHNALYFGIAPLAIVYVAARIGKDRIVLLLATAYLVCQLSYLYLLGPLSDVVNIIVFPMIHEGMFRPFSNFAFLFLLVFSLKRFATLEIGEIGRVARELALIGGLVLMVTAAFGLRILQGSENVLEVVGPGLLLNGVRFAILGIAIVSIVVFRMEIAVIARPTFGGAGIALGVLVLASCLAGGVLAHVVPGDHVSMRSFQAVAALVPVVGATLAVAGIPLENRTQTMIWTFAAVASLALFFWPLPTTPAGRGFALAVLSSVAGAGIFVMLTSAVMYLLARYATGQVASGALLVFLTVLTACDLVVAYSNYTFVNTPNPFVRRVADIYPSTSLLEGHEEYLTSLDEESARPNLIANEEFRLSSGQPSAWGFGGSGMGLCSDPPAVVMPEGNALRLCYSGNDKAGNLYQDIETREPITRVSLGAWIRAEAGMTVRIFLTSPSNNIGSQVAEMSGDGVWHWLTAHLEAKSALGTIRPHINMAAAGAAEVFAPRLVAGPVIVPKQFPDDGRPIVAPASSKVPRNIDLASFRVNHVDTITGFRPRELLTNDAIVARTPTYGGVDSDISRDLSEFLTTFAAPDPRWYTRGGFYSVLEVPRLLDLLGVAYDADAEGNVVSRPDAIPRFAAFSRFEAPGGTDRVLERLKDKDFDPTTTVLLESGPATVPPALEARRFVKLDFRALDTDHLKLHIPADAPRIVVFNDRFSPHWVAEWSGSPLKIVRANGIFMGVVLPEGVGQLTFSFRPVLFLALARLSMAIALTLGLLAFLVASITLIRRRPASRSSSGLR